VVDDLGERGSERWILGTDFWLKQLDLAHARNALVDDHRFRVLQMIIAFQTLVLGAVVFRVGGTLPLAFGGWLPTVIGAGVLFVGLSLFVTCFDTKRWTRELEGLLREAARVLA
jgi:hypothetical protein